MSITRNLERKPHPERNFPPPSICLPSSRLLSFPVSVVVRDGPRARDVGERSLDGGDLGTGVQGRDKSSHQKFDPGSLVGVDVDP